jgi:quinol monooxygenase YgiN
MTRNTLRVVASFRARPDKTNELRALLSGLVEPTCKEAGCICYELLQNQQDPTDFVFVEEWESDATLDAHLSSAHVQAALSQLPELIAGEADIRRYRMVK